MEFKILTAELLDAFKKAQANKPPKLPGDRKGFDMPVDYFEFYKSVSSVYSSRIEGEDIEFDSYYKHRFLKVPFNPDYTRRADDLYAAYDFIDDHDISLKLVQKAHAILTSHILPASQQGFLRTNPMFVINAEDRIEYVAADPGIIKQEIEKLFKDIGVLTHNDLAIFEVFYYAALIHLVFVKIHPFQYGNGRAARLLEKWFLLQKLGKNAVAIQLEKNYYTNVADYYRNIRKNGLEYDKLDYSNSLDFLLMTVRGMDQQA